MTNPHLSAQRHVYTGVHDVGHARTETTRVYTLPTEDDVQAAVRP